MPKMRQRRVELSGLGKERVERLVFQNEKRRERERDTVSLELCEVSLATRKSGVIEVGVLRLSRARSVPRRYAM